MLLQVLSAKTGAVIEVELVRADAEEVKLHRALSDWLAHIRDTSSSGLALSDAAHASCRVMPCVGLVTCVKLLAVSMLAWADEREQAHWQEEACFRMRGRVPRMRRLLIKLCRF